MAQASPAQFVAWDQERTTRHVIRTTPPLVRITNFALRPSEWRRSKTGIRKRYPTGDGPITRAQEAWCQAQLQRFLEVPVRGRKVRCSRCEVPTWKINKSCGPECYHAWHRDYFARWELKLEIRACEFGYGVFVRPDAHVKLGEPLGEYLGLVRPQDVDPDSTSAYTFGMRHGTVDSGVYGNWTRFVNSHCNPNVVALSTQVGKRMMILFQARRDLGPGEQLFINYGSSYFKNSRWGPCRCSAQPGPHVPPVGSEDVWLEDE